MNACVLQGVRAVLAESYEKIHKDHLIGIGIAPLQFLPGENAESLGLSGRETFSLALPEELSPGVTLSMKVPSVPSTVCAARGPAARACSAVGWEPEPGRWPSGFPGRENPRGGGKRGPWPWRKGVHTCSVLTSR